MNEHALSFEEQTKKVFEARLRHDYANKHEPQATNRFSLKKTTN
jgi:hypothetical protein